jgi:two-component system NtrC family sensor kinase
MKAKTRDHISGAGRSLRLRMVIVLLLASLFPLMIAGFGAWIVFGKLLEIKSLELMETVVQGHAREIEENLSARVNMLNILIESHSLPVLSDPGRLREFLGFLNLSSSESFVDIGVIDSAGRHLAYAGPYDLEGKNYREAEWFTEVMSRGVYISDVFLGFREVPHCIIAVKSTDSTRPWILRATINSEQFDQLVKSHVLGEQGDIFIVNREGSYQTTPRAGALLGQAHGIDTRYHSGVQDRRVSQDGATKIRVTTWLNNDRWMLVVEQDLEAVQAPVNKAISDGAKVVLVAIIFLVLITFLATRNLTNLIDKANAERDRMSQAFMRSSKLASIGELATGLAHEINNPLAIISAEQTNIRDLLGTMNGNPANIAEIEESIERSKNQVRRCADITKRMLQFGRSRESALEPTELGPRLKDIVDLLQRRANVRNVRINLDIREGLPPVMIDPLELEQVIINLIQNALDALPKGGTIAVRSYRKGNEVHLEVEDNGMGIPSENLDRIFEPFFTTKPVGKGTGLGLSMCFGIVSSWGGRISARSIMGKGTTIEILLPLDRETQAIKDQGGLE